MDEYIESLLSASAGMRGPTRMEMSFFLAFFFFSNIVLSLELASGNQWGYNAVQEEKAPI